MIRHYKLHYAFIPASLGTIASVALMHSIANAIILKWIDHELS